MVRVRKCLAVSSTALVVLLAALGTDLGGVGWAVGLVCGLALAGAVAHGAARTGTDALGPADAVTLARATIACAVAARVAQSFVVTPAVTTLVALSVLALLLDAVDGRVARWTRTSSRFGARFDGEADAFLILVLSVYVARSFGAWVLLIGLARYVFALAALVLPWLRGALPVRHWAKDVAAIQGVVLALSAADVAPRSVMAVVLLVALALLVESFAWSVRWLWQRRPLQHTQPIEPAGTLARHEQGTPVAQVGLGPR